MSGRSSRGAKIGLLVVVVIAGLIWALGRDSVRPEPPHPLVERPAPVTEDSESPVVLTTPSEEQPASVRSREGVSSENEDAPPSSFWTLEFVGEGEAPLAEIEASVILEGGETPRRLAWTSGSGVPGGNRWPIPVDGEESATIEAWAPGYVLVVERRQVRPGETDVVELKPGATVSGRVVDSRGAPVLRARVLLRTLDEGDGADILARAESGEGGRFRLGTIVHGRCELSAERRQVGRTDPLPLELAPRDSWEAGDLVLLGDGAIVGRVVHPGGAPITGVGIDAELLGDSSRSGLRRSSSQTDEQGRFHLRGLADGEYQLEHSLHPVPPFGDQGRVFTGEGEVLLVLEAVRLSVRAEDAEGRSVGMTGVKVTTADVGKRVRGSWTGGGAQDAFTFYLPSGLRYSLDAEDPEGSSYGAQVELLAGDAERDVILRPPSDASASLEFAYFGPDGARLTDFTVVLAKEGGLGASLHAPQDLEDGVFTGLKPGLYSLEAQPSGLLFWKSDLFARPGSSEVRLVAGQVAYAEATAARGGRIELDLQPTPALHESHQTRLLVRALDAPENTFESQHVFRREGAGYRSSVGPKLGQVWLTQKPLPPGGWVLRVEAKGYRRWEESIVIREGETTSVSVALESE